MYADCLAPLFPSGNKGWANPPESCDVYEDQKAGKYDNSGAYANSGKCFCDYVEVTHI